MEDTVRDAFDYFLDTDTGDVVILSEDIINRARQILDKCLDDDMSDYEEIEFDEEYDIPEWMEDEIALVLDIFIDKEDHFVRIPERHPVNGFAAMREFIDILPDIPLKEELQGILDGKGAFRKFKDALDPYPKMKKLWYGFNAKIAKKEAEEWIVSIGINR